MNLVKLFFILLNLEIALGTESIQRNPAGVDSHIEGEPSSRTSISKRSAAYKRLPGWIVSYGKRSSDADVSDKQDLVSLRDAEDLKELLERTSDSLQTDNVNSIEDSDISDSVNLSEALYNDNSKESDILEPEYEIDQANVKLLDAVREYNSQRAAVGKPYFPDENDEDMQAAKRSGWNAIYGKRMPGWFVGYGKRDGSLNELTEKRDSDLLETYEKRAPQWLATYGKRAPKWLATYGKRAPQWLATYGKRAPQWLATYGKRAPQWLATYGKRSLPLLATYEKRAPQWLATYGKRDPESLGTFEKRAPQWLATYGKRAPQWLATYGKRLDLSDFNAVVKHLSELHRQNSATMEQVNAMPKRLSGWNAAYGK